MTTTDELVEKINDITEKKPLFYFTNDIERGLGIEQLIENYHIICIDQNKINSLIKNSNINVFCLGDIVEDQIYRSSIKLLEHTEVKKYLAKFPKGYLQTFKISPRFEKLTSELGYGLINTSAKLNRTFENKLSQYKLLSEANVNMPKTRLSELKNENYSGLKEEFGDKFIIQFNRGHTGDSTILVDDGEKFLHLQNTFPERTVKLVKYIDTNLSYTLNGCITKSGNFLGGLCYQITGVEGLAHSQAATVGNDYSVREGIDKEVLKQINEESEKISNVMKNSGYRGMYGIDLLIKDGNVYIIEINARQTQSVPFYTKLQLLNNQIPLSLLHLAEFLGIDINLDLENYNTTNLEPINAAQLYLREFEEESVVKHEHQPGIYSKNMQYLRPEYSINERTTNEEIMILHKSKGTKVKKGDEIARIQVLRRLITGDLKVENWAIDYLLAIKKILE